MCHKINYNQDREIILYGSPKLIDEIEKAALEFLKPNYMDKQISSMPNFWRIHERKNQFRYEEQRGPKMALVSPELFDKFVNEDLKEFITYDDHSVMNIEIDGIRIYRCEDVPGETIKMY